MFKNASHALSFKVIVSCYKPSCSILNFFELVLKACTRGVPNRTTIFQDRAHQSFIRAATIHSPHDTIRIAILASRYNTYRDTLFRLEIISNCIRIIQWCSTIVFTKLQSLFEMVQSFVKVS